VTHTRPAPARVRRIRDRLRALYGIPAAPPHGQGVDELVLTVLSQSTSDRNRDVAFLRLRRRFGSWAAVRDAPVEAVEEAIRPGGISRVKSQRIQAILRELGDDLELGWLGDAPVEEGREFLCSLPGVGR
jgi:endonuclease-3